MRSPAPCPATPNCVSSGDAADHAHFVPPLRYRDARDEARTRLLTILHTMPRTRVVEDRAGYLRAECVSRVWRFVDDVECWFDEREPLIHVRSASRTGHSDLGVNRRRVEHIRKRFQGQEGAHGPPATSFPVDGS